MTHCTYCDYPAGQCSGACEVAASKDTSRSEPLVGRSGVRVWPNGKPEAPPKLSKWVPTTDLRTLRRMGKLMEELGELQAVAARVIIQGIDEVDPGTGKVNRQRLLDELADVQAQIGCTLLAFDLDQEYLQHRVAEKIRQMQEWEAMFAPEGRS